MSTNQILGFVDGNPKTKRKEMRDSVFVSAAFYCAFFCLNIAIFYCNIVNPSLRVLS
jgi:hypothetical protein